MFHAITFVNKIFSYISKINGEFKIVNVIGPS